MLEEGNPGLPTIPAVATCVVVPLVGLSVMAAGSAWPVATQWDTLLAMVVVAGASVALVGLIGAAIGLLVMDWLAEIRSRAAWAAVAARRWSAGLVTEREQAEQSYRPAVHDEALQAVLRANRYAVPRLPVGAESERRQAEPMPLGCALQSSADGHPTTAGHPRRPKIGDGGVDHGAAVRCPNVEGARKAWTVVGSSAPVLRRTWCQREFHRGARVVEELRRTVNARTGDAWRGGSSLRVAGIPIKIVSDIVILGQDQNGSDSGKTAPDAPFNGGPPIRAGPSTSTTPSVRSRKRNNPHQKDVTALAEARRQVVALAEALARQAAREDDAAEQREAPSRSALHMPDEQSPRRDEKDDTS